MAASWYLIPVLFLSVLMLCLWFMVLLYWIAHRYLDDPKGLQRSDSLISDDEEYTPQVAIVVKAEKQRLLKEKRKKEKLEQSTTIATFLKPDFTPEEKIIAHTTVDLYLKHSNLDMKLQGSINGIKNLAHPDRGGPHKVRFHFVLFPKKKRKFKTGFQEPLELGIHLPFILNLVDKKDLSNGVLRLRMYGKREKFGLQVSREYCLGEAFIPLFQLDSDEKELNLVQAILPIGERFTSMLRDTPISTPKVRRKHYKSNLGSDSGSGESVNGDTSNRQSLAFSEYSGYSDSAPE